MVLSINGSLFTLTLNVVAALHAPSLASKVYTYLPATVGVIVAEVPFNVEVIPLPVEGDALHV